MTITETTRTYFEDGTSIELVGADTYFDEIEARIRMSDKEQDELVKEIEQSEPLSTDDEIRQTYMNRVSSIPETENVVTPW